MWAETYHSFSDTLNQILLLIGIRTSKKKVSERHPFGYGKEGLFWVEMWSAGFKHDGHPQ